MIPHADIWPNVVIYYYLLIIFWLVKKKTKHNETTVSSGILQVTETERNVEILYANSSSHLLNEVILTHLCLASPGKDHAEWIFKPWNGFLLLLAAVCAVCPRAVTDGAPAPAPCRWHRRAFSWVTPGRPNAAVVTVARWPSASATQPAQPDSPSFKNNTHFLLN